ncbi:MAG: hypothetical protein RLZZ58_576 [Pseudomonadota bacterium]
MSKVIYVAISALCYAAFFVAFTYFAGFVGGIDLLPTHVDKGISGPLGQAVIVDLALIALFGVQHSVMARQSFKAKWTQVVPQPLERSVYCLATALVLAAMFMLWHPIDAILWDITNPLLRDVLWGLFALGFGIVFVSTFLLNHFELFGLAQMWRHVRGTPEQAAQMRTPLFYRWVRHPIYTGFTLAFWSAPTMTVGHMLLAAGLTVYILIGIAYEEKDLVNLFGQEYRAYRAKVGMLFPGVGRIN